MSKRNDLLAIAALLSLQLKGNISNDDLEAAVKEGEAKLRARASELNVPHEGVDLKALVKAVKEAEPEQTPPADPPPDQEKPKAGTKTKARVLAAFGEYQVDDVAELTADELEVNVGAGRVDSHPKAVAYAESLKKK